MSEVDGIVIEMSSLSVRKRGLCLLSLQEEQSFCAECQDLGEGGSASMLLSLVAPMSQGALAFRPPVLWERAGSHQ